MATNKPLTPEEAVDMGRRAVGRRALMRTLRDIFSYRNPLLQFMDAYRFNVIRWSASNLREPTLGKRVRLFLGTRNPLRILRDNFRQNRADLTADWERAVIGRINLSLEELGSIPLHSRPRDLAKRLDRVGRMINRMTGYEHCPSLLTERLLLSTYRYIFMAPHDRRFGALCPDGICGMLRQNGVPPESLYYQNYESLLQGRETVIYEFTSNGKGLQYLRPLEHVRLDADPGGYDMLPARRADSPFDSLWGGRGRAALRKGGKKRKGYRKGEENGPEHKSQKDKGQKQRHEHVTNYSPDKNKNYENRTYRQASHGKEHRLRTGRQ